MSKFLDYVTQGRLGNNEGLYNCFDSFNDYLYNTQKATYYAIGGMPGSGKSGFVDDNFILSPYMFYKNRDNKVNVKWFYYSFEISYMAKRAKWTAYKLFLDYGLQVDSSYILSKGKNRISDDIYNKVVAVDQYMDELFDHIIFIQDPENPTGVYNTVVKHAEQNGTTSYDHYIHPDGSPGKRKTGYVATNPNEHTLIIVDHVGLSKKEKGYDTKQNIDKLSEYMISLRNVYNYTPVMVCQFNKGLSGIERLKLAHSGKLDLAPILEDFKDTGNIGQDCNVALGVFNPVKYDLQDYAGYDVTKMPSSFRTIHLMKNRDGQEYVVKAMHFAGGTGRYKELPPPTMFQMGAVSYGQYQ